MKGGVRLMEGVRALAARWVWLGVGCGALWCLAGCSPDLPPYLEGYTHLEGRTYYRLWRVGDEPARARPGDYISVYLRYSTLDDSLFFEGWRRFQLEAPRYKGAIEQCFSLLSAGDSATFYVGAYDFFTRTLATTLPEYLDSASRMRVDVSMFSIEDSLTFGREMEAFEHWIEDFGQYEQVVLRQYLASRQMSTHMVDSLYYQPLRVGSGPYPSDGDTLTIEFEGRFLDGKYFDSTRRRGEAFQFVLGQKWQVIEGLERAVRLMREGERALFILPSPVAFGQGGSSTGIVPPYTTVIFEVELTELKRGEP